MTRGRFIAVKQDIVRLFSFHLCYSLEAHASKWRVYNTLKLILEFLKSVQMLNSIRVAINGTDHAIMTNKQPQSPVSVQRQFYLFPVRHSAAVYFSRNLHESQT